MCLRCRLILYFTKTRADEVSLNSVLVEVELLGPTRNWGWQMVD